VGPRLSIGAQQAAHRLLACEVRSYEAEYTNQLWHSDYHTSKRTPVLLGSGRWKYPVCLCVMDDHSRLCCHVQWYRDEDAETFAHGLGQAFQKRGLPAAFMTDRGGPMAAAEIQDALHRRLGIPHEPTLPYSPYQNGKQESLWGQLEGRLMAMIEGVPDLSLAVLNEATQAWVEMEYNRAVHSELGCAPTDRYLDSKDVSRPCPSSDELRLCFMQEETRMLRRSDGTVKIQNVRFEIPSAYRTLVRPRLRWARWDLGHVYLVDPPTGKVAGAPLLARQAPQRRRWPPRARSRGGDGGRTRRRATHLGHCAAPRKADGRLRTREPCPRVSAQRRQKHESRQR
jgi:putative transposase